MGEDESRTNVRCADYTAMAQHGEMDRAAADREDARLQMFMEREKSLWERQERLMQEDRDNQRSLLDRLSRASLLEPDINRLTCNKLNKPQLQISEKQNETKKEHLVLKYQLFKK